jgi:hypothetical protein
MSANNGQRARFQRDRKRKVLLRMRNRSLMIELKSKAAEDAPSARRLRAERGPALEAK